MIVERVFKVQCPYCNKVEEHTIIWPTLENGKGKDMVGKELTISCNEGQGMFKVRVPSIGEVGTGIEDQKE